MNPKRIVGLIPAAGKGSRLAPFPAPKELFPVGYQDYDTGGKIEKRPKVISQYLVENMQRAGMSELFIIIGESKHDILRYYGDGFRYGTKIAYLYQERLTGMPGALNLAQPWLKGADVVFGMPDTIIEPRDVFQRLYAFHTSARADLTLGLFPTSNPSKAGMVDYDDDQNVIWTIDKPAESTLKHTWGCACWAPTFSELLEQFVRDRPYHGRELILGDVFNEALTRKMKVKALPFSDGQYIDIGTCEELDQALKKFHL